MRKHHFLGIAFKPTPKHFTKVGPRKKQVELDYDPQPMRKVRKGIEEIHELIFKRYGKN